MKDHLFHIRQLLQQTGFPSPQSLTELPSSGSGRVYFRVSFSDTSRPSVLAAFNGDVNENIAWYAFTTHFLEKGFRVPAILARDDSYRYLLLQDLGDTSLFQLVRREIDDEVGKHYRQVVADLLEFQVEGIKGLDLDVAYPVSSFNKRAVLWDLNYFKYYFVKPHQIVFDENRLEDDFQAFADYLLQAEGSFFNYRDFQSRNIMIFQDRPWYIDFQGGRSGPLQYDLVSLLYQARARLPVDFRNEMLELYLELLEKKLPGQRQRFLLFYNEYIYFRTMQVLGAYGFRGKVEGKAHFLQSIPYALKGLRRLLDEKPLHLELPELTRVLQQIAELEIANRKPLDESKLTVSIASFSYKKGGIPPDPTDNGGGFVFDCRALPNPHRDNDLREFNGTEAPVIGFLENQAPVQEFLDHAEALVTQSCDRYLERGFTHLQVSFGCTGGKHRSVFSAEKLAARLHEKYGSRIHIRLTHNELEKERRAAR